MLSETIYRLRRKQGLSQEQLGEKIGVSRQAISKWEGGQSTPELDKLEALSECFQISLDELTGGGEPQPARKEDGGFQVNRLGVGLCLLGAACLLLFGIFMVAQPAAAEQVNQSSMITLNGSGILIGLFAACMVAGGILIFKKK